MKKKTLLLTMILALALPSAMSATITPENPDNVTLNPNSDQLQEFDIQLGDNDTEVRVAATDTGDFDVAYQSFRIFDNDGTFSAEIQAPNKGNYSHNVTFQFQVSKQNQSDETIERTVEAHTIIPWKELQSDTWINQSYLMDVNGEQYSVYEITDNSLFLSRNNSTTQIVAGNSRMINDVRLTTVETTPFKFAKVRADTKESVDDVSFSLEYNASKSDTRDQQCQLFISTQGGTTIDRGKVFAFQTVNEQTSESVGNTYVRLESTIDGSLVGKTTTDPYGYGSIQVPETLYENNSDTQEVIARVQKEGSECEPSRRTLTLNTPYGEYIEDTDKYQLALAVDNETTYTNITGTVQTKDGGSVDRGIMEVTRPDGTTTDFVYDGRQFNYTPEEGGQYSLEATKQNYVSSSSVVVEYIADRDGDGVPNSEDECPDTEGVAANNGCPKEEVELRIVSVDEGEYAGGVLERNKEYIFRLVNENNSRIDFNGELNVTTLDTTVEFQNGESVNNINFNRTGNYDVLLNESKYTTVEETLSVENPSLLGEDKQKYAWALGFALVLIAALMFYRKIDAGGGSNIDDPGAQTQLEAKSEGGR